VKGGDVETGDGHNKRCTCRRRKKGEVTPRTQRCVSRHALRDQPSCCQAGNPTFRAVPRLLAWAVDTLPAFTRYVTTHSVFVLGVAFLCLGWLFCAWGARTLVCSWDPVGRFSFSIFASDRTERCTVHVQRPPPGEAF